MKKYSKRRLIVITLGMIFAISIFIESSSKYYQEINYGESDNNNEIHLKSAGFWNLSSVYIDDTVATIADKDTFVNSFNKYYNYGSHSFLLAGHCTGANFCINEAYFHFSFDNKPTLFYWVKAEISLDIRCVSSTMNLSYCIIEEPWDEYTMAFNNRPAKGMEITQLVVTQDGVYKVDVSDFIGGRTSISICVYISYDNYVHDYVNITSREGFISQVYAPKLIWTYEKEVSKPEAIPGYNLIVLLGILSIVSIIIGKKIKKN